MNNSPKFKDGDVFCFFGDSIIASGIWMAEVYQEIRKKHKVKCYNCGVSGASAYHGVPRLYSHCLIHNPSYVVIMFGINDINRVLYADSCKDPNKEQLKAEAIARYNENYEWLVSEVIKHGATPIMCTPVPYDDVSDVEEENLKCRKGVEACIEGLKRIQKKHGGYIVDFNGVMTPMLGKEDIMYIDRVHPTWHGYHVMAQTFLHQLNVIDEPHFEGSIEMEDWNKERYDAERVFELINFVEYGMLFGAFKEGKLTVEEKKDVIRKIYSETEDKNGFVGKACTAYLNNIDFREKLMAEVIRLTI